ncbi:MAG: tetraacyldisaccharide 4'-kinase [Phocaeicola sp.]
MENHLIKINKWLYPISMLYGIGVSFRNALFDWGVYKERTFNLPVISVGNITVGGTGKTPHTEYLIKLLQNNYQLAVLSRGYKRKTKGYMLANEETQVSMIGDEPYQMKQKFPNIYMAVDSDRCHGIECLQSSIDTSDVEVIILDDAFQHRYVKPGLNILLVDYNRMITEDELLPAGRMREPKSGKDRASIVIITKCPTELSPMEYRILAANMQLYPYQQLFFSTMRYGKLRPLLGGKEYSLRSINKNVTALLVTGIASPQKMENDLKEYGLTIESLAFSDHHIFTDADILQIKKHFDALPQDRRIVITTEKDAVRLIVHPKLDEELKKFIYVLPIEVEILQDQQEKFNSTITDYVRENSRNRSFS